LSKSVSEPTHRRRNIKHESTTTCIVHTLRDTHHTQTVNNKKTMDKQIIKDIFEWDVLNWSIAIDFNCP